MPGHDHLQITGCEKPTESKVDDAVRQKRTRYDGGFKRRDGRHGLEMRRPE